MAVQTQSPTHEAYVETAKLMAAGDLVGAHAGSGFKSIFCIITACTADEDQTYAEVIKNVATDTGLDLVDATTVAAVKGVAINDTVQVDQVFTAVTGGETILGFGVANDEDDVLLGICCFAAGCAMEKSDTLTVQLKNVYGAGA